MSPKLLFLSRISMIAALAGVSLSGCGGGSDSSGQVTLPGDLIMTFDLPVAGANEKVMFAATSFNASYQCVVFTNKIVYGSGNNKSGESKQLTGNYQVTGFDSSTGACSSLTILWSQPVSSWSSHENSVNMHDCILPIKSETGSVGNWDSMVSVERDGMWSFESKAGTDGIIYRGRQDL